MAARDAVVEVVFRSRHGDSVWKAARCADSRWRLYEDTREGRGRDRWAPRGSYPTRNAAEEAAERLSDTQLELDQ